MNNRESKAYAALVLENAWLSAELEQVRKDADRYRWLVDWTKPSMQPWATENATMANLYTRAMTREEFKDAYRIARSEGPSFVQPGHPARVAILSSSPYVDHLAHRARCAEMYGRGCKPLGTALKLYKIRKQYNTPDNRSAQRSVPRAGFVQLVDREMTIGRCSMEAVNG